MNVADLLDLLACFGTMVGDSGFNPAWDLDGNGNIGVSDLLQFLEDFDPVNGGSLLPKGGK